MNRKTKIIGWLLYWLRERLINLRWHLYHLPYRLDPLIDWLDHHEGESYWRRKDRGI